MRWPLRGLIVAETGLAGSGILVFIFRAEATNPQLRASDEGEPLWVRRQELDGFDLLPDIPQVLALTLDQPDFFYLYKVPDADGGEQVRVRVGLLPSVSTSCCVYSKSRYIT